MAFGKVVTHDARLQCSCVLRLSLGLRVSGFRAWSCQCQGPPEFRNALCMKKREREREVLEGGIYVA